MAIYERLYKMNKEKEPESRAERQLNKFIERRLISNNCACCEKIFKGNGLPNKSGLCHPCWLSFRSNGIRVNMAQIVRKLNEVRNKSIQKGRQIERDEIKKKIKEFKSEFIHPKCINKVRQELLNSLDIHPKDCKGCPDCPAVWTCNKCNQSFPELNTTHKCIQKQNSGCGRYCNDYSYGRCGDIVNGRFKLCKDCIKKKLFRR
jgi:hypothetical protein